MAWYSLPSRGRIHTSCSPASRSPFSRRSAIHKDAASAITLDAPKWDALVGIGSPAAATLERIADDVGQAFVRHTYIEIADDDDEDYIVGEMLVRDGYEKFENALHDGYDQLKDLERDFARGVDRTKYPWCRNPSRSGFGIPIVRQGGNDTFYPDFLVWAHGDVYAIDTKGTQLHADAMRKLVRMRQSPGRPRVHIRFIAQGTLNDRGEEVTNDGLTVIGHRPDYEPTYTPVDEMNKAVAIALKKVK